jgi:hypothetical protein
MSGLTRLANVSASTKRRPPLVNGKIGLPKVNLDSFKCTPLQPLNPDIARRQTLNTPHEVQQTFVEGAFDILEGDILVIGDREYPVKAVEEWSDASIGIGAHLLIIVEDIKR